MNSEEPVFPICVKYDDGRVGIRKSIEPSYISYALVRDKEYLKWKQIDATGRVFKIRRVSWVNRPKFYHKLMARMSGSVPLLATFDYVATGEKAQFEPYKKEVIKYFKRYSQSANVDGDEALKRLVQAGSFEELAFEMHRASGPLKGQ